MSRKPPSQRSEFRHFITLTTRWFDNDVYGHMNNTVHYELVDTAVNQFLVENGLWNFDSPTMFVVVETGCVYHSEMAFPDVIHAGIRVEKMGTSSIRYEVALFRNDDTIAAADAHFVHVNLKKVDRKPAPLVDDFKNKINHLIG